MNRVCIVLICTSCSNISVAYRITALKIWHLSPTPKDLSHFTFPYQSFLFGSNWRTLGLVHTCSPDTCIPLPTIPCISTSYPAPICWTNFTHPLSQHLLPHWPSLSVTSLLLSTSISVTSSISAPPAPLTLAFSDLLASEFLGHSLFPSSFWHLYSPLSLFHFTCIDFLPARTGPFLSLTLFILWDNIKSVLCI